MAARLRLQQEREGRVPADVDPLDRVHLHGDVQRHRITCHYFAGVAVRSLNRQLTKSCRFDSTFTGIAYPGDRVLPKLSIAAKLYIIFTLLAVAAFALAGIAVMNARHQAAMMADYETSLSGTRNVERVNGLIYAVVMESRGVYMSPDIPAAKRYGDLLLKFNDRIGQVVDEWRKNVRSDDAAQFAAFAERVKKFIEFRQELVRLGTEVSPAKGREWGDNEANRSVRTALNQDLDKLAAIYDARTTRIYDELQAQAASDRVDTEPACARGAGSCGHRRDDHLALGHAPARRDHAHHGGGRGRRQRCRDPVWRAPRRDRRAVALDRRVPAGDAPQRRA